MMAAMRTTVTLEPDVEALLKKRMRERWLTFKEALNAAVREALVPPVRRKVDFPTYDMGKPRIDITKALQIAGEMEDEEIMRRMGLDRSPKRRSHPR